MIHVGWRESVVVGMANIARSTGRQMTHSLTEGGRAIVAACASTGHNTLV